MSSTQLAMYSLTLVFTFSMQVDTAMSWVKDSLQNLVAFSSLHGATQSVTCYKCSWRNLSCTVHVYSNTLSTWDSHAVRVQFNLRFTKILHLVRYSHRIQDQHWILFHRWRHRIQLCFSVVCYLTSKRLRSARSSRSTALWGRQGCTLHNLDQKESCTIGRSTGSRRSTCSTSECSAGSFRQTCIERYSEKNLDQIIFKIHVVRYKSLILWVQNVYLRGPIDDVRFFLEKAVWWTYGDPAKPIKQD